MSVMQYCEVMMRTREMPIRPQRTEKAELTHPEPRQKPTRRQLEESAWRGASSLSGAVYGCSN
jgi:hypothetical protein